MKSRIGAIIFVCGCPGLVHASGNVLPRANSESLGMADANVALASGPAAQIINPANIVDTPGGAIQWEIGTLLGQADASFSRTTAAKRRARRRFQRQNDLSAGAVLCHRQSLVRARDDRLFH